MYETIYVVGYIVDTFIDYSPNCERSAVGGSA